MPQAEQSGCPQSTTSGSRQPAARLQPGSTRCGRSADRLAKLNGSRGYPTMTQDKLIILKPDFEDPAYPGERFYCWHCVLMEGLLVSFPALAERIEVVRIAWPQPRGEVVTLLGAQNQSLPVLVLAIDAPAGLETGAANGMRFVEGKDAILHALNRRHGIPVPHP